MTDVLALEAYRILRRLLTDRESLLGHRVIRPDDQWVLRGDPVETHEEIRRVVQAMERTEVVRG